MENVKIEGRASGLLKIELNEQGEYIVVSADNTSLFDKFVSGFKYITDLAEKIHAALDQIEKKYEERDDFAAVMEKTQEMSCENVKFSTEAVQMIDSLFGPDTVRKYFRDEYAEIPDFLPDADGILDFFEQIIPVMEALFKRKVERQRQAGKARMSKYKPQDHKKKGGRV